MTTVMFVVGSLCGLVLACIVICIAVALYIAYTKMDLMLEHLKSCSAVMVQAPLRNGGPWGKILLVGWIAGVLTFPSYYLKHGGVSIEDLNSFPAPLKRKLVAIKWSSIVLSAALVIFAVLGKVIQTYHI